MGVLEGKTAIITGAALGLGRAMSLRLAREGAKVVATDRNMDGLTETERMVREQGGEVTIFKMDVSKEEDTNRMAEKTITTYGTIDVLVNNAAIIAGLKRISFMDISVDEWDRVMAVNVKGYWLCARAVTPQMMRQDKGRIINIASNTAFTATFGITHYLSSKAAIMGLTRSLAGELGQYNITVNNVCPGRIMTEMRRAYTTWERAIELAEKDQLINRPPMPEDITGIVVYLASDESAMMTGQSVVVDGGLVLH